MAEEGIEIPVTVEADSATVTIEKLAAAVVELTGKVDALAKAGKRAGSDLATGFGQGLGQKAFETLKNAIEAIPVKLQAAIDSSAAWADSMNRVAIRSGFAVKTLQEFSLAAKLAGMDLNGITRYANALTPKLMTNEKAFKALGLSASELRRQNPTQVFQQVIDKLKGIQDPAERAAKSIALFGPRLAPQLQGFIDALDESKKRAEELGLITETKTVKAMAAFNDELETLKETQTAVKNTFGSFITADEDLRKALEEVTNTWGRFNKAVGSAAETFHSFPAPVKVATAGIVLFGSKVVGAIPLLASFIGLAAQLKTLGGVGKVFETLTVGMKGFGAAAMTVAPWLLAIAAAAAAIYGGAKLGEWLYKNSELFKSFIDWLSKGAQKLGEFLGLLPDENERKVLEQGVKFGTGVDPKAMKAYEDFVKAQKERAAAGAEAGAQAAEVSLEALQHEKEMLSLQGQINSILAGRAGAIAAANEEASKAVRNAELDYMIAKEKLAAQADELGKEAYDAELGRLKEKRDLVIETARLQREAAIGQEQLRVLDASLDRYRQEADLQRQIEDAREFGLTTLERIDKARADSIASAQREHDLAVRRLDAEKDFLKLTGARLEENRKAVEDADKRLAMQKELAAAVAETAMKQQELNFAQEHGLDVTEQTAKATAEALAYIDRALANPKALITEKDLKTMDGLIEKANRLGVSLQDLGVKAGVSMEEFRAKADEAFRRIEDQKVQEALTEIANKMERGVKLKDEDLQGLVSMRENLSAGSKMAGELDRAIGNVGKRLAEMKPMEIIKADAVRLAEQLSQKLIDRVRHSKQYTETLKEQTIQLLIQQGIEPKLARAMVEKEVAAQKWGMAVDQVMSGLAGVAGFLETIGVAADSAAGKFLNMAQGALQAAQAGKQAAADWKAGNKTAAVGAGLGVAGDIYKGAQTQNAGAATAQGAMKGAAFGAQFGPWGALIGGVAGALVGFFGGSKFRKIAKDAGKVLGTELSDEAVKKIQEDAKKLGISIQKAALLNISTAIEDSGKKASEFGKQIQDLMKGVADGSIPAKEGLEEIAKTFGAVADEALKAGRVGDRTMTGLIKTARALKLDSPEIKAFVGEQLDAALAGVHKFVGAIKVLNKEWLQWLEESRGDVLGEAGLEKAKERIKDLGQVAGVTFGAMFNALSSERGMVAAVDALSEDFTTLKESLTESLGEAQMQQILGPFGAAFDTLQSEHLRPLFEGIDGLSQAMKGLANAAYLDVGQFTAMQKGITTLFDQAIAGGADMKTALQAVAPAIQTAISAAESFGVPLDEDTKRMKELAEQNGITFKTDPQQQMLDVLVSIADVLGAKIPESVNRAKDSFTDLADTVTGPRGPASQAEAVGDAWKDGFDAARSAGDSFFESTAEGVESARRAGEEWAAAQVANTSTVASTAVETLVPAYQTVAETMAEVSGVGNETWIALQDGADAFAESLGTEIPDAAAVAMESLQEMRDLAAEGIEVGGGGTAGGTNGPKAVNANVTVNLGINENPLAAADTAAQMRQTTIQWTAEAIEDRIPAIVSAIEGA